MIAVSFLLIIVVAFIRDYAFAANYWIDEGDLQAAKDVAGKNSHDKLLTLLAREDVVDLAVDLHIELTTIGTGNEFFALNADSKTNREEHAIAEAAIALSEKLYAMPVVFPLLQLASAEAAEYVKGKGGDIRKAMGVACRKIDALLKQHPNLTTEYDQLKAAAIKRNAAVSKYTGYYTTIAKNEQQGAKNWADSLNSLPAKRFVVNGVFFNETIPDAATSPANFESTRAMIELSLDPNYKHRTELQRIYDDVLDTTAKEIKTIGPADIDYGRGYVFYRKVAAIMGKNLVAKLPMNPEVYKEWKAMKKFISAATKRAVDEASKVRKGH